MYAFFKEKGYSKEEIDSCIDSTNKQLGGDVSDLLTSDYKDFYNFVIDSTDIVNNAKQIYNIYDSAYKPPEWVLSFLSDKLASEKYLKSVMVFYPSFANIKNVRMLCTEREPVNIGMDRRYDQQAMQENFGWMIGYYMTETIKTQKIQPNIGIYCKTPVIGVDGKQYPDAHIYNAIGAAFDDESQIDYQYFIKDRTRSSITIYVSKFYEKMFDMMFQCLIYLRLPNIVISGVGANNFAALYPGCTPHPLNTDAFHIDVWAPTFYKVYNKYKQYIAKINSMGFANSAALKYLEKNYNLKIVDLGFFPQLLNNIDTESTLLINAWDPYSIVGNGNKHDNSLDGFIGRNTACGMLCWPKTNPHMKYVPAKLY